MTAASRLRLAALTLLWGAGFLFIKVALRQLSPYDIVLGCMLTAAVAMIVFVTATGQRLPRDRATWSHLLVMAAITNVAPYLLFAWAENRISSGLAGVINATTPLFTFGLCVVVRIERPAISRLAAIAVGFGGIAVIAAPWAGASRSPVSGVGAALLGSASYAAAYVYARHFLTPRPETALALSAGQMVAGTFLLTLAAPFFLHGPAQLSIQAALSVVALGMGSTGVGYVLTYQLIADEGPTSAALATYLAPIVAVGLGALFLAETLTWRVLIGATIILIGVAGAEGRWGSKSAPRQRARSRA